MGEQIILEAGIPIPEKLENRAPPRKRVTRYGELKAALSRMIPGDSFVYPNERRWSVLRCARHIGVRVATRSMGDGTVRIWCVDDQSVID